MPYSRRILHYADDAQTLLGDLSARAIGGCWFELLRQGGCGRGEVTLNDAFPDRHAVGIGDWIAFEYAEDNRWYLGRVESRRAQSPAGVTFALSGMSIELHDVFPGGFGSDADGTPPHRFGRTDAFLDDPDWSDETLDSLNDAQELVVKLLERYIVPQTHIQWDADRVETSLHSSAIDSVKFRGEDSAWSILQDLALRGEQAAWGVDEQGDFFFLRPRSALMASFREGQDILSLIETQDRELIFNRVLLTGDFIYTIAASDEVETRAAHRWRGNYIEPVSRASYGDRQIQILVPWIRSQTDAREFVEEFFRQYAEPRPRYRLRVRGDSVLPKPWEGRVELLARDGSVLIRAELDRLRVEFDRVPIFELELGSADPRAIWPGRGLIDRVELPVVPAPGEGGELISLDDRSDQELSDIDVVDTPCCAAVPVDLFIRYHPTGEEISLNYNPALGVWKTTGTLPMHNVEGDWQFTFYCVANRWRLSADNGEGLHTHFTYPIAVCPLVSITYDGNPFDPELPFAHIVHDGSA